MLQCHIKPIPAYSSHVRGKFQFLRDARGPEDKRKSGVVDEVLNPAGLFIVEPHREILVDPKAKVDSDEAGKPIVLTLATYEMLKEVAGISLVIEPVNDPEESGRVEALAKKLSDARVKAAEEELRKLVEATAREKRTLEDQLSDARAKIADFESMIAAAGKKR